MGHTSGGAISAAFRATIERAMRLTGQAPGEGLTRADLERLAIAAPLIGLSRWAHAVGLESFGDALHLVLIAVAGETDHQPLAGWGSN